MRSFVRSLALLLLFAGSAQAAEHDWPIAPRARDARPRFALSVSDRSGLAEAPFVTAAFPQVSGFATALTGSAAMQVSSFGWLRLQIPVTYVRLDFPARAQVGEVALGNLELGVEHTRELRPLTQLGFVVAWLAPSADHGPGASLLNNRALTLASALGGNRDARLFTPGVTGLRLGVSFEHAVRSFDFRASLELPLLIRISDASLPDETEAHSLGLVPTLDVRAAWWAARWFGVSLGAALVAELARIREPTLPRDRTQRLQPIIEPGLHLQVGRHVAFALGGSVPVAGPLGGEAWGVDLQARFAF